MLLNREADRAMLHWILLSSVLCLLIICLEFG